MISQPLTHIQARDAALAANLDPQLVASVLASLPSTLGTHCGYALRKAEKSKVGRPRTVTIDPSDHNAALKRSRERRMKSDTLLKTLKTASSAGSPELQQMVLQEMAREAAMLDADREHFTALGKDTSGITSKRIGVLRNLADQVRKTAEASSGGKLDLKSRAVHRLYRFFVTKVKAACQQFGMSQEQVGAFLFKLGEEMESWEEEAAKYINASD